MSSLRTKIAWSLACVLFAACGGSENSNADDTDTRAGTEDAGDAPVTSAVAFAVMVRSPDTLFDYLIAQEDVPSGKIDLKHALELPGGNFYPTADAVYYGNFETKTMQRYVVTPDYAVELSGEFSLNQLGVDFANEQPLFFSDTSAYYVATAQGLVVHFNPTSMEILGSVDVPELLRKGYAGYLGGVQRAGDRYLATIRYDDPDDYTKTAPDSSVAIAVSDNPKHPLQIVRDDRAAAAGYSFMDDDGNYYALTGDSWLYLSGLQDIPKSALLRVKAGEDRIDKDYLLDLGKVIGTPAVNGLWPLDDAKFVTQAWAADVDYKKALPTPDDYWTAPYFDWVLVDAKAKTARVLSGLKRGAAGYGLLRMRVDDTTYIQQYSFPQGTDVGEKVDLYAVHADATVKKVASTSVGDFRFMSRVATSKEADSNPAERKTK